MNYTHPGHLMLVAYILWIFGFTGSHRFYYGKPISGTVWFLTFGLFGIGWLVDIFLIPFMDEQAETRYVTGKLDYNIGWLLLTFLGMFGAHRFYMGKWISGIFYFLTLGWLSIGVIYDFWTLNEQIDYINRGG